MKLKKVVNKIGDTEWFFYCPGCKEIHSYRTAAGPGQHGRLVWGFDGNEERPTFTPSLLRRTGPFLGGRTDVCHLFLTDGKLKLLGDCTHSMAGQTVDLPDLPEKYQKDEYYQ